MPVRSLAPASAVLIATALLLFVCVPVFAHDEVGGTPDITIAIGRGLSDRDVRVDVGDIVRFVNRDDERHRMRSRSGERGFDTGNLEPGESAQVRISTAGTYTYLDERERDDSRYYGRIVAASGTTGSTAGTAQTPAGTATVTIGDRVFQPALTTITVRGTVTFQNADSDEHTATSADAGGDIDSGVLSPDASHDESFPEAGTFEFLCAIHPDMRGTISVVGEAPKPTTPSTPTPTTTPTPDPTPIPATTPPSVTAPDVEPLDIVEFAFDPTSVEIPAGTTVLWTNSGVAPHTVSAKDGSFGSEMLAAGASFEHTFTTPGSYAYLCQVHPEMTGAVVVTEAETAVAARVAAAPTGVAAAPAAAPSTAVADQSSLAGVVLAVALISIASALFARLLGGLSKRAEGP